MTKEVLIHIKGTQTISGIEEQEEAMEVITVGEYYFRNQTHYLMFDEMMEDFKEPIHTMIKLRPGLMEVRKRGLINVHMIFERDKKNLAYYKTPFGTMEMEISATRVAMEEAEEWMNIRAEYALVMNESPVADCLMEIKVTSKGAKKGTEFFQNKKCS